MLIGAGGGKVTTQIPVTLEDHSLMCRLNRRVPPDLTYIAAGAYCVYVNISVCLTAARCCI